MSATVVRTLLGAAALLAATAAPAQTVDEIVAGLGSGVLPARRAASLDPIEALGAE